MRARRQLDHGRRRPRRQVHRTHVPPRSSPPSHASADRGKAVDGLTAIPTARWRVRRRAQAGRLQGRRAVVARPTVGANSTFARPQPCAQAVRFACPRPDRRPPEAWFKPANSAVFRRQERICQPDASRGLLLRACARGPGRPPFHAQGRPRPRLRPSRPPAKPAPPPPSMLQTHHSSRRQRRFSTPARPSRSAAAGFGRRPAVISTAAALATPRHAIVCAPMSEEAPLARPRAATLDRRSATECESLRRRGGLDPEFANARLGPSRPSRRGVFHGADGGIGSMRIKGDGSSSTTSGLSSMIASGRTRRSYRLPHGAQPPPFFHEEQVLQERDRRGSRLVDLPDRS